MAHRLLLPLAAFAVAVASASAEAKLATCFTTDDGRYPCDFSALDGEGSFRIAAPGKPTFALWMIEAGVASGTINMGDRDVNLPGTYRRASDDPACWDNADTQTRICAW